MKKTYITPALLAVKIEKMLMESMSVSDKEVEAGWSNKYEGPAGGLIWEDDNNEAE